MARDLAVEIMCPRCQGAGLGSLVDPLMAGKVLVDVEDADGIRECPNCLYQWTWREGMPSVYLDAVAPLTIEYGSDIHRIDDGYSGTPYSYAFYSPSFPQDFPIDTPTICDGAMPASYSIAYDGDTHISTIEGSAPINEEGPYYFTVSWQTAGGPWMEFRALLLVAAPEI